MGREGGPERVEIKSVKDIEDMPAKEKRKGICEIHIGQGRHEGRGGHGRHVAH